MAKHSEKNNKRMKRAVDKVIKDIKSLDCVVDCSIQAGRGPTSNGNYKKPYVVYVKDTESGLVGRIHVGCGYQNIHVTLKNSSSTSNGEDPRRAVIRYLVYFYQLPASTRDYEPPPLQHVLDPYLFEEKVMKS